MDQSLDEFIKMSKQKKSEGEISQCGMILGRSATPSESSRCSLDEIISSESFTEKNMGTLSSLEYVSGLKRRREDRLKIVAFGLSDKKPKFVSTSIKRAGVEIPRDEDVIDMEVENLEDTEAKSADNEKTKSMIDSLQVLDLLANAGNRIQIITHRRKATEDEDIKKTSEWKEKLWVVEIFLIGLDREQKSVVYSNMGIGASFRKVVAKYAAAENLFANLKATGYITNFPTYYTPLVVRLGKSIFFDLKRVSKEKGEILSFESRVEFTMNNRIIHVCEVKLSDQAISLATHRFEEQAQYLAASKAYYALTAERYPLEKFIKGDDLDYDIDEYDMTESAGITVATTPLNV